MSCASACEPCRGVFDPYLCGAHGELARGGVPIGDSLAVFRIEFSVLLAVAAAISLYLGRALIPGTAGLTVALSIWSLWPFVGDDGPIEAPNLRLHQHNVLYGNDDLDELIAEVSQLDADILTFQEISETNFARLKDGLLDRYPHYQVCIYNRGGVAVMMRNSVSVHQLWPWPKGQFWQKEILADDIALLPAPVIMAGDFNNVPWAYTVRSAAKAAGGVVAKGLDRTYLFKWPWPRFRIDHVIAPVGAKTATVLTPSWGSDHLGITADIQLNVSDD